MSFKAWREVSLEQISNMKYGKMPKKDRIRDKGYPIYTGYKIAGFYDEYMFENPELLVVARGVGGTGDVKIAPPKSYITNLSIVLLLVQCI
jgi:type I restriction enzyme S subunit